MRKLRGALIVSLILTLFLILPKDVLSQDKELDSQKKLRQEIQLLNLLNGLYLSDEQMRFLLEQARRAEDIRKECKEEVRRYSDASTQTLERLKAEIEEDKSEVSKDVARETHQTNRKILELKANCEKKRGKIVAEVKNNLTGKQLYIIEEFKPCLVPPKGAARFGQAVDPTGGVKQLERIRQMPAQRYSLKKYEFAGRMLERALLHKQKGTEVDEEQLRNRVFSTFDEARGLSEIDFNLKKEELAGELKEYLKPEHPALDIDRKIEHFLLSPVAVDLLEDKLSGK